MPSKGNEMEAIEKELHERIDSVLKEFEADIPRMLGAVLLNQTMMSSSVEMQVTALVNIIHNQKEVTDKVISLQKDLEVLKAQVTMLGIKNNERH